MGSQWKVSRGGPTGLDKVLVCAGCECGCGGSDLEFNFGRRNNSKRSGTDLEYEQFGTARDTDSWFLLDVC